MKFKQVFKRVGSNVVTQTTESLSKKRESNIVKANERIDELERMVNPEKIEIPIKTAKITDPNDPEFVIDNPHSPDFGKKVKDTFNYKMLHSTPVKSATTSTSTAGKSEYEQWKEKCKAIIETGHRRFKNQYPNAEYSNSPRAEGDTSQTILTGDESMFLATPPKRNPVSSEQAYYIASQKYYLLYENGIAYVYKTDDAFFAVPAVLSKYSAGAVPPSVSTGYALTGKDNLNPVVNLSREEFQAILAGKPSYEALTSAYRLFANTDKRLMDLAKAKIVW